MKSYKEKRTSYEGFERMSGSLTLKIAMHFKLLLFMVMLHIVAFFFCLYMSSRYETQAATKYYMATGIHYIHPNMEMRFTNHDGGQVISNAKTLSNTPWLKEIAEQEISRLINLFLLCSLIYLLYPVLLGRLKAKSVDESGKKYIRGSKFISAHEYQRDVSKTGADTDLPFGNIFMPVDAEQKHCFVLGRPGVGKTVAMSQILDRLKERDSKVIVYDQKGDYLAKFYNPKTDLIFNPLDQRSVGWNLFNEITTYMDMDAIAASLIPDGGPDPFWKIAARGLLRGILRYLYQTDRKSHRHLWEMLTTNVIDMKTHLKDIEDAKEALQYIDNSESKSTQGIISVMIQHTQCLEYMMECDGDFSVDTWLKQEGGGIIFITNYSDIKDTLKPILSLFIDILGRKLLSMPDNYKRRVFFLLDEFGTLQRLTTILELLTLSRSKGGSVFLGIQDYGQIDKIYGKEHRQSIVNACGNSVTFSVKSGSASEASNALGEIEFMETEETFSIGGKTKTRNLSQRKKREAIMLPSDLMNLPDLTGIVKIANFHHVRSFWTYKSYQDYHPSFLLRDNLKVKTRPVESEEDKKEKVAKGMKDVPEGVKPEKKEEAENKQDVSEEVEPKEKEEGAGNIEGIPTEVDSTKKEEER